MSFPTHPEWTHYAEFREKCLYGCYLAVAIPGAAEPCEYVISKITSIQRMVY